MQDQPSPPAKPVSDVWRPDLVSLPRLTLARRVFRAFMHGFAKVLAFATMRPTIRGLENFPGRGPAVMVFNHLGDADVVLMMAALPSERAEGIGKIELYEHWLVGPIFRAYGIIWVHRGQPDRRALRAALDGLAEGRIIVLAPEGRQSLSGGLEEGTVGAAFLALRSGAPVVPVALTGTENRNIYGNIKRLKRTPVTLSVGKPFLLEEQAASGGPDPKTKARETMRGATRRIMQGLAALLPETYRGKYGSTQAEY